MRFGALSLLRYGHFRDRELALPRGACDFHVIYGPNEAGKSTCQSALGDLLFGIPTQTGFNFLHANKDLRIGATLEREGETQRLFRRKGNKDTLLDEAGEPLLEMALDPFLGGADRAFFERMFSLNHRRLEAGGQEILAAEGHVGQTLFAAGAGLSGLREALRRLDDEADALWAPRASKKRAYYAAEERLKQARQRLREASVAVRSWKELSRKVESLKEERETARRGLEEANRRKGRVERIRRVLPHLTLRHQHREEIAALGELPTIPEDASQRLREAEDARTRAQTQVEAVEGQLATAKEHIGGIVLNEAILGLGENIDALAQERRLIEQAQRELPGKQAKLAAAHQRVQRLARDLGWGEQTAEGILERLPARVYREQLYARVEAHEGCRRDRDEARSRRAELKHDLARVDAELEALGTAGNGDELTMALRDAHRLGDADKQLADCEQHCQRLARELDEGMAALAGWNGSPGNLAVIRVPSRAEVEGHRDELSAISERLENITRQQQAEEDGLEFLRLAREQAVRDGQAMPRETLIAAREQRDGYWERIRSRWLDRLPPQAGAPADETLAECFGTALEEADELADRRFSNAEAAAALLGIDRDIERTQKRISQSEQRRQEEAAMQERQHAGWLACWRGTGVTPAAPASMLSWLEERARLLKLREELDELKRQSESLRGQMHAHREKLSEALTAMGATGVPRSASFAAVLEHAADVLEQAREQRAHRRQLTEQRRNATERLAAAREQARRAEAAYERWRENFSAALAACDLDRGLGLAAAKGARQTLEDLAGEAEAVARLAAEVARDSRQVGIFGERAEGLLQHLGEPASDEDPHRVVQRLSGQLAQERQRQLKRHDEGQRIEKMEEELKKTRAALAQAKARIKQLCATAGAKDVAGLNEAIDRDVRARELRTSMQRETEAALAAGDGLPLSDLQAESANTEVDALGAEARSLDEAIAERTEELNELSADLRGAESELRQLDGDETAAIAENQRQQALTDMGEAVHGYAWKRGASILLRWSLDRYRREKQGPMLFRAGELFRVLTSGAFERLEVDFDEQDRPELTGLRAGGERVRVSGMSDGTADQLYLALRIAAIEEYLEKAPGLPFVADDLFINFDDARAAAGLKILAALAQRTQVLFFTHHGHLVELAQGALPGKLQVVEL